MTDEVLAVEIDEVPELTGRDVRIFSFSPGVVATAMQTEIRDAKLEDFPRRERFEELYAKGQLHDPQGPAHAIADLLESGAGARHEVLRYEG